MTRLQSYRQRERVATNEATRLASAGQRAWQRAIEFPARSPERVVWTAVSQSARELALTHRRTTTLS